MKKEEVVTLIKKIELLLEKGKENKTIQFWKKFLSERREKLEQGSNPHERAAILKEIKNAIPGGMGSMHELALSPKDGSDLSYTELNADYAKLVHQLFEELKKN
ncbi:Uncharacterised protein [uncultured archaeon]|nr:Uncharacterised protein [uncultured archaeon]